MTSLIAFQGEPGAYSEAAAIAYFGEDAQTLPCHDFDQVFDAVTRRQASHGILPIENTLGGSIHRNYDLLLRNDLSIIGEIQIPVVHNLIALPGVTLADIKQVYSHPQGLAQCEQTLKARLPHAKAIATYDTAGSVKMLHEQNIRDGAALASARAAQLYQMNVLDPDMRDDHENYTRFLIVTPEPMPVTGDTKTSIVFAMENVPGALFKCLAAFALRDIDLTKIESRPLRGSRWRYMFYIDFIGNQTDEAFQNALRHLQEFTSYLKVLGSYQRQV